MRRLWHAITIQLTITALFFWSSGFYLLGYHLGWWPLPFTLQAHFIW